MGTRQSPESHQSSEQHHIDADLAGKNILNHALEVREQLGTMCAIEYLKSNNVDSERIFRMLRNQRA